MAVSRTDEAVAAVLQYWSGEDNASHVKRLLAHHILGNRSRLTATKYAISSSEASHMLHQELGSGWQAAMGLPRLMDILNDDQAFCIRLLRLGEQEIKLKVDAVVNCQREAWTLQRAVDLTWPASNPLQFLKRALAVYMVKLRRAGDEMVAVDAHSAGEYLISAWLDYHRDLRRLIGADQQQEWQLPQESFPRLLEEMFLSLAEDPFFQVQQHQEERVKQGSLGTITTTSYYVIVLLVRALIGVVCRETDAKITLPDRSQSSLMELEPGAAAIAPV